MGLISDYIVSGAAGGPKRLRRMAPVWRGLLSGHDQRAADLERVAARGMLWECEDADLDLHLRNTGDKRAVGETNAGVRAYLKRRFDAYKLAGTPEGIKLQLGRHGIPESTILIVREIDLRKAAIAGAFGGNIGYYYIVLYSGTPFSGITQSTWDGGESWDGTGLPVWGGLPAGYIDSVRDFVRRWESGGESCRYILAAADNTFSYDTATHTYTGGADVYPVQKAWEWEGGLRAYYGYTYTTP